MNHHDSQLVQRCLDRCHHADLKLSRRAQLLSATTRSMRSNTSSHRALATCPLVRTKPVIQPQNFNLIWKFCRKTLQYLRNYPHNCSQTFDGTAAVWSQYCGHCFPATWTPVDVIRCKQSLHLSHHATVRVFRLPCRLFTTLRRRIFKRKKLRRDFRKR